MGKLVLTKMAAKKWGEILKITGKYAKVVDCTAFQLLCDDILFEPINADLPVEGYRLAREWFQNDIGGGAAFLPTAMVLPLVVAQPLLTTTLFSFYTRND